MTNHNENNKKNSENSENNNENNNEKEEDEQKSSRKWNKWSVVFVIMVWVYSMFPTLTLRVVPDAFLGLWQHEPTLTNSVYLLPTTRSQAFDLGSIVNQYSLTVSDDGRAVLLDRAAVVAGLDHRPTEPDLLAIRLRIDLAEQGTGVWVWITGLFSLFNLLLVCIALGIAALFPTVVQIICDPILDRLAQFLAFIVICLQYCYKPCIWIWAMLLVCQGGRYPPETGMYLSLLGSLMGYIFASIQNKSDASRTKFREGLYGLLVFTPLAVRYDSQLFGFGAVWMLYMMIGLSTYCEPLLIAIGFRNDSIMEHATLASALLLVSSGVLRLLTGIVISRETVRYLFRPFGTALMTLSSLTYFLALLIMSTKGYWHAYQNRRANDASCIMFVSLLVVLATGFVLDIPSLYYTATVFGSLFVGVKIADRDWSADTFIVIAFCILVAAFIIIFYLQTHIYSIALLLVDPTHLFT
jgi:hypothetical protein